MVAQLLASPQFAAFAVSLVLGVLWQVVGRVGQFLEAQGDSRKIVALVVIGKQLEALGYDGDKLKGKPGAPETQPATITINTAAQGVDDAVGKAIATAISEARK